MTPKVRRPEFKRARAYRRRGRKRWTLHRVMREIVKEIYSADFTRAFASPTPLLDKVRISTAKPIDWRGNAYRLNV